MIFAAACGIGIVETAVIWNNGSAALVDPVLFIIVHRRPAAAAAPPGVARRGPGGVELGERRERAGRSPASSSRLPEVRWALAGSVALCRRGVVHPAAVHARRPRHQPRGGGRDLRHHRRVARASSPGGRARSASARWPSSPSAPPRPAPPTSTGSLDPILSFLLAGAVGAVASVIIGLPALRIRGLMLAVTTLAFAVATSSFLLNRDRLLARSLPDDLTDRVTAVPAVGRPSAHVSIGAANRPASTSCAVAGLALVLLAVRGLQRSRNDARHRRDPRQRAQRAGVPPEPDAGQAARVRARRGSSRRSRAGCWRCTSRRSGQEIFAPVESLRALTMVVVGGLGSVPGAILGAIFLKSTEWFTVLVPQQYRYLFTFAGSGIGLLLVLWLLPGGFGSVLYRVRDGTCARSARRRKGSCRRSSPTRDDPEVLPARARSRRTGGRRRRRRRPRGRSSSSTSPRPVPTSTTSAIPTSR